MLQHTVVINTVKLQADAAYPAHLHLTLPLALWERIVEDIDRAGDRSTRPQPSVPAAAAAAAEERSPPPVPSPPRDGQEGRRRVEFAIAPPPPPPPPPPAAGGAPCGGSKGSGSLYLSGTPQASQSEDSACGPSSVAHSTTAASGTTVTTATTATRTEASSTDTLSGRCSRGETSPPPPPHVPDHRSDHCPTVPPPGIIASLAGFLCCSDDSGPRAAKPSHRAALVAFRLRLIKLCDRWGRASKHNLHFTVLSTAQPRLGLPSQQIPAQADLHDGPWVVTSLALNITTAAVTLHTAALLSSVSLSDITSAAGGSQRQSFSHSMSRSFNVGGSQSPDVGSFR